MATLFLTFMFMQATPPSCPTFPNPNPGCSLMVTVKQRGLANSTSGGFIGSSQPSQRPAQKPKPPSQKPPAPPPSKPK